MGEETERQFGLPTTVWGPLMAGSAGGETTMGGRPYSSADMVPILAERLRPLIGDRCAEAATRMCLLFIDDQAFAPIEAMRVLMGELHDAQIKIGILSNGPSDMEATMLLPMTTAGWIDALGISGRDGVGKPAPEAFHRVLNLLGAAPANTWLIDDAPGHIEAGRALGLNAIYFDGDVEKLRTTLRETGLDW